MTLATKMAKILMGQPLTKLGPILAVELVKWTKGMTANDKVRDSRTWLMTRSLPAPALPPTAATMAAGMMVMPRVMDLLIHGFNRIFRNPSMTICPARVPIMVEACPLASSPTPNRILAACPPSAGASSS
ncbi:hypothetical protein Mapa_000393 [Marchantia paleacea]|nr:hypothetical protein Mapa_000393 [Marchantia paleacea]